MYISRHSGDEGYKKERLERLRTADGLTLSEGQDYEATVFEVFHKELEALLERLGAIDPQLEMNGFRNVWIAKPNCTFCLMQSYHVVAVSVA